MQVFYVNIGGGEPTVRKDFWELVDYATAHHVGVKFSTNGSRITPSGREGCAASDYVDVQISLDGATAEVNDAVRGAGSYATAICARWSTSRRASRLQALRRRHARERRRSWTRSRRSPTATARSCGSRGCGRRGAAPTSGTSCTRRGAAARVYDWLLAHGEDVLTGDSFFHLAAYGETLPGPEPVRRRARRVPDRPGRRRLRVPVRDPRRRSSPATCARPAASRRVWRESELFLELRGPQAAARARAAALRRLPRRLHGGEVLHRPAARRARPGVRARPRRGGARGGLPRRRSRRSDHSRRRAAPARRYRSRRSTRPLRRVARSDARWFETVAEAQRRADEAAARVGLQGAPGRLRARADARATTSRRSPSWASRRTSPGSRPSATSSTTVMGVRHLAAGADLADRRAGRAPRRRGRPSPARPPRAAPRWALSAFASSRDRGGRRRQPADVLPDLLGGLARGDRGARRTGARGGRGAG